MAMVVNCVAYRDGERLGDIGMIGSARLLANGERTLVHLLRLDVASHGPVEVRQIVQRLCDIEVVRPQYLFAQCE